MVGVSRLLTGSVTPSDVPGCGRSSSGVPAHLLRCSADKRPVGVGEGDCAPPSPTTHRPPLTTHAARIPDLDFSQSPFIVIWEVTRACDLACLHCRASAEPRRHPLELTTAEGFRLLDQVREFGKPMVVFTGGDPIKRPDVCELVAHAHQIGLRPSMSPSATPLVTRDAVFRLKEAGLMRMAISLDGARAETHDAFRRVSGSFQATLDIVAWCREAGLPLQINTTVSRYNLGELDDVYALVKSFPGMALWSVFFLVPTGRAKVEDELSPEEHEQVFHRLVDLLEDAPFDIKTTAAQHYRRVLLQRRKTARRDLRPPQRFGGAETLTGPGFAAGGPGRAAQGVNDGNGFLFVSHLGQIFPSGFLPIPCGNVRRDHVVQVYRESPVFQALRDPDRLKGKCGACEYRRVCGGSRARAYAITGDYLESEPYCAYVPPAWEKRGTTFG